jgi:hypothetical protein
MDDKIIDNEVWHGIYYPDQIPFDSENPCRGYLPPLQKKMDAWFK